MRSTYILSAACALMLAAASTEAQTTVKTITIVNGDTTIAETNVNEGEEHRIEKDIRIVNEERKEHGKRDGETQTYVYTYRDGDDRREEKRDGVRVRKEGGNEKTANISVNIRDRKLNVKINAEKEHPAGISVLDGTGKQIFHETSKQGTFSKELALEPGKYVLTILHGGRSETENIEVK
jgi:hypothetical protein